MKFEYILSLAFVSSVACTLTLNPTATYTFG
jgi:hypothetical protein